MVKILDFGIAKLLSTEGEGHAGIARTRTGALLGTPIYMSPEQCRGAAAVDWRADIYAMGCILFEMLAGRPPFTYEGFGELIAAHISEPPPSLLALRPRITPAVAAFVARLLEKDPARRPQSMEAAGKQIADVARPGDRDRRDARAGDRADAGRRQRRLRCPGAASRQSPRAAAAT